MMYAIMTSHGFQMRGSEAAVYTSVEKARSHMAPGDSLIPIDIHEHGNWRNHAISISGSKKQVLDLWETDKGN